MENNTKARTLNTYFYKGNQYTTSSGVYNNEMLIEGRFLTTDPLLPNSSYTKADFLPDPGFSFSFSDGCNTYSSNDPYTESSEHGGFEFTIETGEDAMPKFWFIFLRRFAPPGQDTSSEVSTSRNIRPASFDYATTARLVGQDTEEIGRGEVKREGRWTTGSVPKTPSNFKIEE